MGAHLEQEWLRRYLGRELEASELEWFEAYVLDKPVLLDAIDEDTSLRDGLRAVAGTASDHAAPSPKDPGRRDEARSASVAVDVGAVDAANVSALRPRKRPVPSSWMALAASLLLGIGGGWLGHGAIRNAGPPEIIANPPRIFFDTLRGGEIAPQRQHSASKSEYVLIEVAVPPGATEVRVEVDGHAWPLIASSDSVVSFVAGRKRLNDAKSVQLSYIIAGQPQSRNLRTEMKEGK